MSRRSLVNYVGIAILLLGMVTGEFLYWRGLHAPQDDGESPYDSRVYQEDMRRTVGAFGLLMEVSERAMTDPKELGMTIAVAALAAAGGCFLLASRMPRD